MSETPYSCFSIDDLVTQFERSCLKQYDTGISGDMEIYDQEYSRLEDIKDELQARGINARRSLLRLLKSSNKQVQLMAAQRVYAVARVEARACLQKLAESPFPDDQVFAARMCLHRLEEAPDCLDH